MLRLLKICLLSIAALTFLSGCGGDSGGSTPEMTQYSMRVAWPDRSRDVTPPASALSAKITVESAGSHGEAVEWTANRSANADAHVQTTTSGVQGTNGSHQVVVRFYTDRNGAGSLVGTASFNANIPAGGEIPATVTVQSRVSSVTVSAGQSVLSGQTKALVAVAKDAADNVIALEPGAVFWTVTQGQSNMVIEEGLARGVLGGMAMVTARVDGITSAAGQVEVLSSARFIELGTFNGAGKPGINGVSGDGRTLVGSAFVNSGSQFGEKPFRWTEAGGYEELQIGLGSQNTGVAFRTNRDGSQVVGYTPGDISVGWVWRNGTATWIRPLLNSDYTVTVDLSDDGRVIVGSLREFGVLRALRWKNANSWTILWNSGAYTTSQATSVSADGDVVVGYVTKDGNPENTQVIRQYLDDAPDEVPLPSGVRSMHPFGLSADGSVIVGAATLTSGQSRWFRWHSGTTTILDQSGVATSCNADGSIVIGNDGEFTFVWTQASGVQTLEAYAASQFGLSVPGRPKLGRLISDNGTTLTGGVAPFEEFYEKPWVIFPR